MRRSFLTLSVISILAGAAAAQQSAAPPRSADWTGYYTLARGKDLEGLKPIGLDIHTLIVAHLQPWAKLKMEATDGVAEDTGQTCQPSGIFRYQSEAGAFRWLPTQNKIVIGWHRITTGGIQRVYMNRPHPRNLRPSWNGDSIGRWEGDTLVVDTVGLNGKSWLGTSMEPHSEEAHVIQRIRSVKEGRLIEMTWTVEDRLALTSAYTYSRYYKRIPDTLEVDDCSDDMITWVELRNQHLKPQIERSKEVR